VRQTQNERSLSWRGGCFLVPGNFITVMGAANPIHLLTFIAALGSGLVAGIFFAFSNFVMKALARVPPAQGVAAMQSINFVVLNEWFFAVFFGTAVCCLALAITSFVRWQRPDAGYLLAGSLLYLIGAILVTIACNVPLNDALAAVDPASRCRSCMDELSEELDGVESCANDGGACRSGFIYSSTLSVHLSLGVEKSKGKTQLNL
jgi:uncharacterized membrane protein